MRPQFWGIRSLPATLRPLAAVLRLPHSSRLPCRQFLERLLGNSRHKLLQNSAKQYQKNMHICLQAVQGQIS